MRADPVFNVSFVGLIEKHSCLYAFDRPDYHNRVAQEKAWEAVAQEVSESVAECKERWKNIRGCYTRYLKSLDEPTRSSGTGGKKQPYYLAETLTFLLPYTKSRKYTESPNSLEPSVTLEEPLDWQSQEGDEECSAFPQDAESSYGQDESSDVKIEPDFPPPQQKRIKLLKESSDEHHHVSNNLGFHPTNYFECRKEQPSKKSQESDLAFLTSLLSDMQEMTSNQKRRFKIGILNIAGQILNELPSSSQPCSQITLEEAAMTPASSCASSPASSRPT